MATLVPAALHPKPNAATAIATSAPVETGWSLGQKASTSSIPRNDRYLVASPYSDAAHVLDLHTLDKPYQLIARALATMHALSESYATMEYQDAFNWHEVVEQLKALADAEGYLFPETSFFVIVFRSRVPSTSDGTLLGELDAEAHREAVRSGGLLKYWFGTPDAQGRNLATCLWRDRGDASLGGAGKGHAKAMEAVRGLYLEWQVERLRFTVARAAKGFNIASWS